MYSELPTEVLQDSKKLGLPSSGKVLFVTIIELGLELLRELTSPLN